MTFDRKSFKRLSLAEEKLLLKIKDTNSLAREKLIVGNMRIVFSIINRNSFEGYPKEDQVMDGVEALICAVDYFDPSRGNKFITYAYKVIENALRDRYIKDYRLPYPKRLRNGHECILENATCEEETQTNDTLLGQIKELLDTIPEDLAKSIKKRYLSGKCVDVYNNDGHYHRKVKKGIEMIRNKANLSLPMSFVQLREMVYNNPAYIDIFESGTSIDLICSRCANNGMTIDKSIKRVTGSNDRPMVSITCNHCHSQFFI